MKSHIIIFAVKLLKGYFATFIDQHVAPNKKEDNPHFYALLEHNRCLDEYLGTQVRNRFL